MHDCCHCPLTQSADRQNVVLLLTLCTRKTQTTARQTIFGPMAANRRLSVAMVLCWTAGVCDRERFPYETTRNNSYSNDGDEAAALLVRADCVDIVMDATVVWPHRVCTALCARTGWCRATDTRVHATTTTNDKNNGARVYRTQRTYEITNEQTNKRIR